MNQVLDVEFSAGVIEDINNLLLSTPKRYKLTDLKEIVTKDKYPFLFQLMNTTYKQQPSTPSPSYQLPTTITVYTETPTVTYGKILRPKPSLTQDEFNALLITLSNNIGKRDISALSLLFGMDASDRDEVTSGAKFMTYLQTKKGLTMYNVDTLHRTYTHLGLIRDLNTLLSYYNKN